MSEVPVTECGKAERPYGEDSIALLAFYATYNLLFTILYYNPSIVAVWLIIVLMQYAFAYGLWKPKRWAGEVGVASLALGMIMSVATLLASIALSTVLKVDIPVVWHILPAVLNTSAFYRGWRFLNKPEVRDYIELEGHPKTAPFRLTDRRIPDTIRGKRPESVAWITEARSVGQIFLVEDSLIIVKSPSGQVIDIPMKDVVEMERGEM